MRWVLITEANDQIASALIKRVRDAYYECDKHVWAKFIEGESELSKIRIFHEQYSVCTDISAPSKPEKNVPSKAADKIVLRLSRSTINNCSD